MKPEQFIQSIQITMGEFDRCMQGMGFRDRWYEKLFRAHSAVKFGWQHTDIIKRDNPILKGVSEACSLTDIDIDCVFLLASINRPVVVLH